MSGAGNEETQSSQQKPGSAALMGIGAGFGLLGCLFSPLIILLLLAGVVVVSALGIVFLPITTICWVFGCGGGHGEAKLDNEKIVQAYEGDGRGELNEAAVPAPYLALVKDAGAECRQIGPIVIAAQIQHESGFVVNLVGTDGAQGISQMPPDKFEEFGKDDDNNGKTSALDAADSIRAQGRYMCSLAKEVDTLVGRKELTGNRLNLTLAAYDMGLDAVKQAKQVPDDMRTQNYIMGIRTLFSVYSKGAVEVPDGAEYPVLSPPPTNAR
ncbi:transglycosylase SLT domain-containing protein [Streptomyces sp. NRRL S-813]|uniref:transglycosylase SLT domain-containing protein n=1 Tax=Streptomyces sp. NRRL S-813 TaxID=1463919 RepID=UPI00131DDA03|nr:transglycosylase SLT domain-containing protein [Streptomyces sp. NRRL S-813]